MKHLLLTAFLLCMVSIAAHGQRSMTDEEKNQITARYQEYMNQLNLTDEQKPKVQQINKTYAEALSQLRNSNESRIKKIKTYKKLRANHDEDLRQILTAEQFQTYKTNQEKVQKELKERRRRNR